MRAPFAAAPAQAFFFLALCLLALPAHAADGEKAAAKMLERIRDEPPKLRVFLQAMPKGGDLHNHLDGSVYAEDYLRWAAADGFCVDRTTTALTPPPCTARQAPARGLAERDPAFYQAAIDGLSMRNFVPGTGTGEVSGHDHAFETFPRFGPVFMRHIGDALAVTRQQAARSRVSYIEQIADPPEAFAIAADALKRPWTGDLTAADAALAPDMTARVAAARKQIDNAEATMRAALECGTKDADPGCEVTVRYLYFVLRTQLPAFVFAQMALGFALADADPRFVGIELVGPEDNAVALRDFALHMEMFRFFRARHPGIKLSLHAGELSLGLVPPDDLRRHVRDTVTVAGAKRIGHAYGLPYEDDAAETLALMARDGIAIEVNLTSNAITPGIAGPDHPLHLFLDAGVPVVLGTDDEGVFRIDMTHEFQRAVGEQGLDYPALKALARNSLTYSFLPDPEKAALRERLERDFTEFETRVVPAFKF